MDVRLYVRTKWRVKSCLSKEAADVLSVTFQVSKRVSLELHPYWTKNLAKGPQSRKFASLSVYSSFPTMDTQESTPLIPKKKPTPLPKFQLFILLWVQLAEPITSQVIYPFINKVRRRWSIMTPNPTAIVACQ